MSTRSARTVSPNQFFERQWKERVRRGTSEMPSGAGGQGRRETQHWAVITLEK